ncbi:unnamed protein product [Prorocentrum cordatum]|uniref:Uncharacterized protein n=1 Tax=Prorocentrum cordatum TaxID=2364126 RepID=A0ABN9P5U2_9DINO|nr:unnamed protein product [Polarella glacialis]
MGPRRTFWFNPQLEARGDRLRRLPLPVLPFPTQIARARERAGCLMEEMGSWIAESPHCGSSPGGKSGSWLSGSDCRTTVGSTAGSTGEASNGSAWGVLGNSRQAGGDLKGHSLRGILERAARRSGAPAASMRHPPKLLPEEDEREAESSSDEQEGGLPLAGAAPLAPRRLWTALSLLRQSPGDPGAAGAQGAPSPPEGAGHSDGRRGPAPGGPPRGAARSRGPGEAPGQSQRLAAFAPPPREGLRAAPQGPRKPAGPRPERARLRRACWAELESGGGPEHGDDPAGAAGEGAQGPRAILGLSPRGASEGPLPSGQGPAGAAGLEGAEAAGRRPWP